ncbi:hypothetical protein FB451DRAFT_1181897 [Mycena latifolia]|nr:hypothetical protein FB451DRAFT_1181897 [Mycena latifolia]
MVEEFEDAEDAPRSESAEFISANSDDQLLSSSHLQSAASTAANSGAPSPTSMPLPSSQTVSDESEVMVHSSDEREEGVALETEECMRDLPPHMEAADLNESVTTALSHQVALLPSPEYAPFFEGMGCPVDVYQEPLEASVERYHIPYDAASVTQEDPLLYFGAVGGKLPSMELEHTLALCDAVVRYSHPHCNFVWEHLSDLIQEIASHKVEDTVILPIADPETKQRLWSLNPKWLAKVVHAVVAVDQILDVLGTFLGRKPSTRFTIDPAFKFTADVHIRSQLHSIWAMLTGDTMSDHISSVDSTISEVRELFGRDSASKELYRLISRPDYVTALLGAGHIRDTWSVPSQSSTTGGPSVMRTTMAASDTAPVTAPASAPVPPNAPMPGHILPGQSWTSHVYHSTPAPISLASGNDKTGTPDEPPAPLNAPNPSGGSGVSPAWYFGGGNEGGGGGPPGWP